MIRVRFAPSPTGYLHLGNVRTALFNFLMARKQGGRFILRIEDTDQERSREEYRRALVEDLEWMGLVWDEGPVRGGPYGPYLQSERLALYQDYVNQLVRDGKAYACYVTEEETEEMKEAAKREHRSFHFDNRGRNFSREEIERRKTRGIKPTIRFKIDSPELAMRDLIRGEVHFHLDEMMGDFVIQRADGLPTFHLAVCVDDALMKITHVIRGEDHLSNTPKHILLLKAMGFEPPQYGHLSLVLGPGGEPLSKRLESVSVRQFRRQGYLPQALANYIALLGWAPGDDREIFTWQELQQVFDLARVGKSASIFDSQKLDWVSGQHLRMIPAASFTEESAGYLSREGKLPPDEKLVRQILPVFQDNIERLEQLEDRLKMLDTHFAYENEEVVRRPESREIFKAALEVLSGLEERNDLYEAWVEGIKPRVKAKGKNLFMPLRLALTGKEHGPELKRFFPVLGIPEIRRRLERALNG